MGSAHVVAVPLGADPSLLGPLITATGGQGRGGRGPVGADGCVLVHDAAQGPTGAGVLGRGPDGSREKMKVGRRRGTNTRQSDDDSGACWEIYAGAAQKKKKKPIKDRRPWTG